MSLASSSSSASSRSPSDDSDISSHSDDGNTLAGSPPRRLRRSKQRQRLRRHQRARAARGETVPTFASHQHRRRPGRGASTNKKTSSWTTREQQFEQFRASVVVLPVPDTVVRVDKPRGFCLHVMTALQWVLPEVFVVHKRSAQATRGDEEDSEDEEDEDDEDGVVLTLGVHVSLFHVPTKRFFGNTWVSPEVPIDSTVDEEENHDGDHGSDGIRVVRDPDSHRLRYVVDRVRLNVRAYFCSSIVDADCVGIVELVGYRKDRDSKATIASAGCGWAVLPLFTQQSPPNRSRGSVRSGPEAADSIENSRTGDAVSVYAGNPRILWELPLSASAWASLATQGGCKLYYQLQVHEPILQLAMGLGRSGSAGLVRRNELVGALDVIPGLRHGNLASIDAGTNPKLTLLRRLGEHGELNLDNNDVNADGSRSDNDSSIDDDVDAYVSALSAFVRLASLVPKSLQLEEAFTLTVSVSRVHIELREQVELDLIARLKLSRRSKYPRATAIDGHVSARVLKLALHNGRCFATRQHTVALKVAAPTRPSPVDAARSGEGDTLHCVRQNASRLRGFVFHPFMAIVVTLQFTVHFRLTWPPKLQLQQQQQQQPLPEEDVVMVTMGSRVVVPSDGHRIFLMDKHHPAIAMTDSSSIDDLAVGQGLLHVNLFSGSPCRPYSEHPLYIRQGRAQQHNGASGGGWGVSLNNQSHQHTASNHFISDSFMSVDLKLQVDTVSGEATGAKPDETIHDTNEQDSRRKTEESTAKAAPVAALQWAQRILEKADSNSVLARTLNALAEKTKPLSPTKTSPSSPVKSRPPSPLKTGMLTHESNAEPVCPRLDLRGSTVLSPSSVSAPSAMVTANELTRASKTLLMRYGFMDAHDSAATQHPDAVASGSSPNKGTESARAVPTKEVVKSLQLELDDVYHAHEIRFHFAAFRAVPDASPRPPRRVYFTFQFYSFPPTRTETLRLSDAFASLAASSTNARSIPSRIPTSSPSSMFLLMRESPASQPSLAIQFDVDTSNSPDPLETRTFAEYLLYKPLYVDVWDADTLFQLGTAALPLHELLRQGAGVKQFQGEVEIHESVGMQLATSVTPNNAGDNSFTRDLGTRVVGRLQFLVSNYGLRGRNRVPTMTNVNITSASGYGGSNSADGGALRTQKTAKYRVRARPLVESNAELKRVLTQEGFYSSTGRGVRSTHAATSTQSRSRVVGDGGSSDATTLTPREIEILCKLFRPTPSVSASISSKTSTRIECDREGRKGLTALLSLRHPVGASSTSPTLATSDAPDGDGVKRDAGTKSTSASGVTLGQSARLKRVLSTALATDPRAIEHAFGVFDKDGDTFISREEFVAAMRSLGTLFADLSDDELSAVASSIDNSQDGRISFQEFQAFAQQKRNLKNETNASDGAENLSGEDKVTAWCDHVRRVLRRAIDKGIRLRHVFQVLDVSGDGTLSADELRAALQQLGAISSQPQATAMPHDAMMALFMRLDRNQDGKISYDEFLTFLGFPDAVKQGEHADDNASSSAAVKETMQEMETAIREVVTRMESQGVDVAQLFRHFDRDGNGTLEMAEMISALQQCLHMPDTTTDSTIGDTARTPRDALKSLEHDALRALIHRINRNGDDVVDYQEFLGLCGIQNTPANSKAPSHAAEKKLIQLLLRATSAGLSWNAVFAQFDRNGDGAITSSEFDTTLHSLFVTDKPLGSESTQTTDMSAIVARFDKNGDDRISLTEFQAFGNGIRIAQQKLISKLTPHAEKLGNNDFTSTLSSINGAETMTSSWMPWEQWLALCGSLGFSVSVQKSLTGWLEQLALVDESHTCVDMAMIERMVMSERESKGAKQHGEVNDISDRLRELLSRAAAQGVDVATSFAHFDVDGDGEITPRELRTALQALGNEFQDVDESALKALVDELDRDGSGSITFAEFQKLLPSRHQTSVIAESRSDQPADKNPGTGGSGQKEQGSHELKKKDIVEQLTKLLDAARAKGLNVNECFQHFDKNEDGLISRKEFVTGMNELGLGGSGDGDDRRNPERDQLLLEVLDTVLDVDQSGSLSLTEFKRLFTDVNGAGNAMNASGEQPAMVVTHGSELDPQDKVKSTLGDDTVTGKCGVENGEKNEAVVVVNQGTTSCDAMDGEEEKKNAAAHEGSQNAAIGNIVSEHNVETERENDSNVKEENATELSIAADSGKTADSSDAAENTAEEGTVMKTEDTLSPTSMTPEPECSDMADTNVNIGAEKPSTGTDPDNSIPTQALSADMKPSTSEPGSTADANESPKPTRKPSSSLTVKARASSFAARRESGSTPPSFAARKAKTDSDAVAAEAEATRAAEARIEKGGARVPISAGADGGADGDACKPATTNVEQDSTMQPPLIDTKPSTSAQESTIEVDEANQLTRKPPGSLASKTRASSFAARRGSTSTSSAFAARKAKTDSAAVDAEAVATIAAGTTTEQDGTTTTKATAAGTKKPSLAAARMAARAKAAAEKRAIASSSSADGAKAPATNITPISDSVRDALSNLRGLLSTAQSSGVPMQQSFDHFDKEKKGLVSYAAFGLALGELGTAFQALSDADCFAMAHALDTTQRGHLICADLSTFVEQGKPTASKTSIESESEKVTAKPVVKKQTGTVDAQQGEHGVAETPSMNESKPVAQRHSSLAQRRTGTQPINKKTTATPSSTEPPSLAETEASGAESIAPQQVSTTPAQPSNKNAIGDSSPSPLPCMADGPADPVAECTYEFHRDPEVRAVEVKLRRAALAAYERGILPLRIVHRMLDDATTATSSTVTARSNTQSHSRQKKPRPRQDLLRVEFMQVLMEMGFSLLTPPPDNQQDSEWMASEQQTDKARRRMHDDLYARQLERLARYKDHVKDETRAHRSLVRAVQHTQERQRQKQMPLQMQRATTEFAHDKAHLQRVLAYYRDGHKKALVYSLLRDHVTTQVELHPRFAEVLFGELAFVNPYPHQERFRLEWLQGGDDTTSSRNSASPSSHTADVITDSHEWRFLRRHVPFAFGNRDMAFHADEEVEHEMLDSELEAVLAPHEALSIPVRLRWLRPTASGAKTKVNANGHDHGKPVAAATRSLVIKSCSHGHTVALFTLALHPQPFVCHRVRRFTHRANAVWRWRVQLPARTHLICMDPRVAVEESRSNQHDEVSSLNETKRNVLDMDGDHHHDQDVDANDDDTGMVTVTLRCRVGPYPSLEEFYVVLYEDEYLARVHETWLLRIQAVRHQEVHTTLGQPIRSELVVMGDTDASLEPRGHAPSRHVRCVTSWHHLDRVAFQPAQVFALQPGVYNRVVWQFLAVAPPASLLFPSGDESTTMTTTTTMVYRVVVHLVDVSTHELVSIWLLHVSVGAPTYTKSFELVLPSGRAATKKIAYKNPWDQAQVLTLRSSAPQLMRPRDSRLALDPHGQTFVRLVFPAPTLRTMKDHSVLLFLNDQDTEESEECLRFHLRYESA